MKTYRAYLKGILGKQTLSWSSKSFTDWTEASRRCDLFYFEAVNKGLEVIECGVELLHE